MKSTRQPNDMNYFFWYFPAQEKPEKSPVVVWLNGGPGATDILGIFAENGPCKIDKDLKQVPNPNSWNKKYNMLYVDQPMHVGYSYDQPTRGFFHPENGTFQALGPNDKPPPFKEEFIGTFSSQDPQSTANTTLNAARHFWNLMQVLTRDFLKDQPSDGTLSIWAESFGGHYSPVFARFTQDQNIRIAKGKLNDSITLDLSTVGIMNGCVDTETEILSRPEFAFDTNTYGIQHISKEERDAARELFSKPGGCRDMLRQCNRLGASKDVAFVGRNDEVNKACSEAERFCSEKVDGAYFKQPTKRSTFDITQCVFSTDVPNENFRRYLNSQKVIDALQLPVNLTEFSRTCFEEFEKTGDGVRRHMPAIASLLDLGIPIAMVYGDRDWICNWRGQVSKAIKHTQADRFFNHSGYTDIEDDGKVVGQVRQQGLLSFTRLFQASHFASASQPESSFTVFDRAMQNKDIATGKIDVDAGFATEGSVDSTVASERPALLAPVCSLLSIGETCAKNQIEAVVNGTAAIKDGIVTSPQLPPGICPTS
ncbi:hypothetical protein XA68_17448 [Ophiocordyceps unilateralis]|uniref:Carboxypeptidase n=1 Tax=Ophiocordyceps unilateralis TaxID=268505 RepID=A0A2A9PKQ7_OPHUN|nr:hypothetical protein XA68_17448 [Ophiocordyceps unilateralis]